MKKDVAIELKNISAGYENEIVIENINCEIYDGDFFGIIGPNGGGKSTLLKIVLGLLSPINGNVFVYGQLPKISRKNIGYVPQYCEYGFGRTK